MEYHTGHTKPTTPRPRNDERERVLLARVAGQDRQAFEELYIGYHRRLTRFLMRIAPRYDIAEEVINDTFWIVWQKAADFRGGSQVSTWIMGIAYRRALKALRALKPEAGQSISNSISSLSAELVTDDPNDADAIASWVQSALTHLPLEQRMAIELAYYLGHSCEEIGTIMECPVSTVKARMFHARQKLKQLLPRLAGETEEGPV